MNFSFKCFFLIFLFNVIRTFSFSFFEYVKESKKFITKKNIFKFVSYYYLSHNLFLSLNYGIKAIKNGQFEKLKNICIFFISPFTHYWIDTIKNEDETFIKNIKLNPSLYFFAKYILKKQIKNKFLCLECREIDSKLKLLFYKKKRIDYVL